MGRGSTNTLQNSLIAGNSATNDPDCHGSFTSQGYNLIGIIGSARVSPARAIKPAPAAVPLNPIARPVVKPWGVSTPTMELLPRQARPWTKGQSWCSQPRIKRGSPRSHTIFAFHSQPRPAVMASDIGAFELSQPVPDNEPISCSVVFSWPVNYAGYTLRWHPANSHLPSPGRRWTVSPVIVGSNYTVTNQPGGGGTSFYRLVWAGVASVSRSLQTRVVGTNGAILSSGTVDPHWTLIQSADASISGTRTPMVVNDQWFSPFPPLDRQRSGIQGGLPPQADESIGNLAGNYKYRIMFDLTGLELPIAGRQRSLDFGMIPAHKCC